MNIINNISISLSTGILFFYLSGTIFSQETLGLSPIEAPLLQEQQQYERTISLPQFEFEGEENTGTEGQAAAENGIDSFYSPAPVGGSVVPAVSSSLTAEQAVISPVNTTASAADASSASSPEPPASANAGNPFPWLKLTQGTTKLPKDSNQIWVEYDISPYTGPRKLSENSLPNAIPPQQEIVDWILAATPKNAWHGEPFSILCANSEKLYVYHTIEMQRTVADIVARFVNPNTVYENYSVRAVSVGNPSWRSRLNGLMQPVSTIQTPGVQGALLTRENAGRVLGDLTKRNDFKDLFPPSSFYNGTPLYAPAMISKQYNENIKQVANGSFPSYAVQQKTFEEGYLFSLLALMDSSRQNAYMMFKCDMKQLEKLYPVVIDAPTTASPRQRMNIDSPQIVGVSIEEYLRWPKEYVLLLDLGMIPIPSAQQNKDASFITSLTSINSAPGNRAKVLVFLECRGPIPPSSAAASQPVPVQSNPLPASQPPLNPTPGAAATAPSNPPSSAPAAVPPVSPDASPSMPAARESQSLFGPTTPKLDQSMKPKNRWKKF